MRFKIFTKLFKRLFRSKKKLSKERILEKIFFINDVPFVMEAKRIAQQMQTELKMGSLTIVEPNGKVLTPKEEIDKRKGYVV